MATGKDILVVDDDDHIRDVVVFSLEKAGFHPREAVDGKTALTAFKQRSPDLLILDILMPEMQGTDVCREIRKASNVPIIFLSSCTEETDRIIGLELGGDDYVMKPFSPRELIARVKAVLRRQMNQASEQKESPSEIKEVKQAGSLKIDPNTYQAFWNDNEVILTATEFAIMETLFRFPGKVYSRSELLDFAYEPNLAITDRTIDSHVRRIRKKFREAGGDPIETMHGIGYRLAAKNP